MILETIEYIRAKGHPKEWKIVGCDNRPVRFDNLNLLVGKNASGKSRTLNVFREISGLFSESIKISSIVYPTVEYLISLKEKGDDNDNLYEYRLNIENRTVTNEVLSVNGKLLLNKAEGLIFSHETQSMNKLSLENDVLAVSLHNLPEFPFLKKLYDWGNTLKLGLFTNQKEKDFVLDDMTKLSVDSVLFSSPIYLLHTFWTGRRLYGDKFVDAVKSDMEFLEYPIDSIDILKLDNGYGICVKEGELEEATSQHEMSQGMYRALSFIIHFNLAVIRKVSACVLLDDLGEGLDFDRSKLLIDLLVRKIADSNLQIFVTTNDRYIMNKIPLKYWSVIERSPKASVFHNYYNAKNIFEDFDFTGLSNFDFIATDFYLKGFGNDEE